MKHERANKRVNFYSGIRYRYILLYILLLLVGCRTKTAEKEIVIISTNDIHGHIDQFPKLATFVERVKAEHPNVILVDAGDRFTGNPYVDYAEERGKPIITLMNALGYSVATLGNHECDYGQETLRRRINDASFPIICANINSSRAALDTIAPYHSMTVDGLELCFIGLTQTTNGLPYANPYHFTGITFDDYRQTAARYKYLKQNGDALVAITHLGVDADSVLAMSMPELDVIIGGHTHTLLDTAKFINDVMIGQSGIALKYAGVTILKFSGKKLIHRSFRSVNIDTITRPEPRILDLVNQFYDRPEFKKIVGHTSRPLSQEMTGHIVTTATREATRGDFAFYNLGGIRKTLIPPGDITLETLLEIEPFGNHIVIQEMTAEDIKLLLLNRFNELRKYPFTDLLMAGGTFSITRDSTGKGIDVLLKDHSGTPLANGKRYRVALNNYINAEYSFPGKGKGIHSGISVMEALLAYLKKHPSL